MSEAGTETAAPTAKPRPWLLACVLLAAALPALLILAETTHYALTRPPTSPSWHRDIDTALIHDGLLRAPRFVDTLRWWTGTWVGQVPFYRPLTSYVFWLEWKALGDDDWFYRIPSAVVHLAATVLFGLLLFRLAERRGIRFPAAASIAGAWAYSGMLYFPNRNIVVGNVAAVWKNQPDSLAALCCFAALLCYLRIPRDPAGTKATRLPRPLFAATGWFLAACGFKEIAFPLCAVFIVLEWDALLGRGRVAALRRLAVVAGGAVLFLVARTLAIGGVGYTYGSNNSWLRRTLLEALGPYGWAVISGDWLGPAMVTWAFIVGAVWWRRQRHTTSSGSRSSGRWRVLFALMTVLLGWLAFGFAMRLSTLADGGGPTTWDVELATGFLLCFTPATRYSAVATLSLLVPFLLLWARHRWVLALGVVWVFAFMAPLTLSPGPIHRFYLPQAGYLLIYGLGVAMGLSLVADAAGRFRSETGRA